MMNDSIISLLKEAPRTLKDLSDALGVSKKEMHDQLNRIGGVFTKKTISYNGKSRPVVIVHYCVK